MMTGQLLGGTSPLQAAYYQMLIIYMIGGSTAFSLVLSILFFTRRLIDDRERLNKDLIVAKEKDGDIITRFSKLTYSSVAVLGCGYFSALVLLCAGGFAAIANLLDLFPPTVSGYLHPIAWISLIVASVLVAIEKRNGWNRRSGEESEPLLV